MTCARCRDRYLFSCDSNPVADLSRASLTHASHRSSLLLEASRAAAILASLAGRAASGRRRAKGGPAARAAGGPRRGRAARAADRPPRSVGEPGQLQAFETTAVHARIPGYVKGWTVNIGSAVKKGQVLAELSVPELEAELRQKGAAVEQARASQAGRGRGRGRRRPTSPAPRRSSRTSGPASSGPRPSSPAGRPSSTASSSSSRRAQTGSLLDETRSKLRSAEATREEVHAQVKTAEVALIQAGRARQGPGRRRRRAPPPSTSPRPTPAARGAARLRQDRGALRRRRHPAERRHRRPDPARRRGRARCSSSPGPTS